MPKITLDAASGGAHGRLTRPEAASYLGVAASTMADWQRKGLGPASVKVGGRRFYRVEALNAFIASGSRARHETTVER
jgi:predicted site-specific integrase-resolvase